MPSRFRKKGFGSHSSRSEGATPHHNRFGSDAKKHSYEGNPSLSAHKRKYTDNPRMMVHKHKFAEEHRGGVKHTYEGNPEMSAHKHKYESEPKKKPKYIKEPYGLSRELDEKDKYRD